MVGLLQPCHSPFRCHAHRRRVCMYSEPYPMDRTRIHISSTLCHFFEGVIAAFCGGTYSMMLLGPWLETNDRS